VVGLVASRLAERMWRPVFVLVEEDGRARGSGRSVPGFALFEALRGCSDLLERYGGHDGAAGVTLPMANLPAFQQRMNAIVETSIGTEPPIPELKLDGELPLSALTLDVLRELERLEPCGQGNPAPSFAAVGLRVVGNPQIVGSSHLAFWVRQGETTFRTFAPNGAERIPELRAHRDRPFALAFRPFINSYRGRLSVELRAEDIQWEDDGPVEGISA